MRFTVTMLGLVGCNDTYAPSQETEGIPMVCAAGSDPRIEVGHGELRFEAFDDGPETLVELIHGPQGGFHSTIAVRADQLNIDTAYVIELVGTIDGMPLGGGTPISGFRCNYRAEAQDFTGGLLIWDAEPEDLHMKTATVEAYVIDPSLKTSDGQSTIIAQDTAAFTIWDPALENE